MRNFKMLMFFIVGLTLAAAVSAQTTETSTLIMSVNQPNQPNLACQGPGCYGSDPRCYDAPGACH
jgi:uncharacterized protein (DUF779 family)